MRQIKFRGKRIDNREWVYGCLSVGINCCYIAENFGINTTRNGTLLCCTPNYNEVDPATIGQFTGLLDKNGNEIWEGDVYRIEFSKIEELYSVDINVIKYSIADGYSGFTIEFSDFAEVIGNIHDNPSLLTNK